MPGDMHVNQHKENVWKQRQNKEDKFEILHFYHLTLVEDTKQNCINESFGLTWNFRHPLVLALMLFIEMCSIQFDFNDALFVPCHQKNSFLS